MVVSEDNVNESNSALDALLWHVVKGITLPPGVNISAEILAKFKEGDKIFSCKQCSYVGDRRNHARLHVLRIHVRQNRPIVGKRKFLREEERVNKQVAEMVAAPPPVMTDNDDNEEQAEPLPPPQKQWGMPPESRCFFFGEWNRCTGSKAVADHFRRGREEDENTSSSSSVPNTTAQEAAAEVDSCSRSSSCDDIQIATTTCSDEDCYLDNECERETFTSASYWDRV